MMRLLSAFLAITAVLVIYGLAQSPQGETLWTASRWSPYVCGILIGLLNTLALALVGDKLGASSRYTTAAGYVHRALCGSRDCELDYFEEHPPKIGWGLMLIIGVILGAFLSARLSGDFEFELLPEMFAAAFGDAEALRIITALLGGAVMSFGARMAGGCTSGHGLSGTSLLNLSSWVALLCFFIGGMLVAFMLY